MLSIEVHRITLPEFLKDGSDAGRPNFSIALSSFVKSDVLLIEIRSTLPFLKITSYFSFSKKAFSHFDFLHGYPLIFSIFSAFPRICSTSMRDLPTNNFTSKIGFSFSCSALCSRVFDFEFSELQFDKDNVTNKSEIQSKGFISIVFSVLFFQGRPSARLAHT